MPLVKAPRANVNPKPSPMQKSGMANLTFHTHVRYTTIGESGGTVIGLVGIMGIGIRPGDPSVKFALTPTSAADFQGATSQLSPIPSCLTETCRSIIEAGSSRVLFEVLWAGAQNGDLRQRGP
jgi:hypothetical protein